MKNTLGYFLSAMVAMAAVSCQFKFEEEGGAEEGNYNPPASYLEIVAKYRAGAEYKGSVRSSSSTTVSFSSGDVIIPDSDIRVYDCTPDNVKAHAVKCENGEWIVGNKSTGILRNLGTLEKSLPVYAYFDKQSFRIRASNAEVMMFQRKNYVPYQIPCVKVWTDNKRSINSKTEYVPGKITVEDPSCTFADTAKFSATMRIRGRGNTTWNMPKKPYKIKLDEKHKILGMPKDKEWVLLANYDDKSLLRNITAMEISRRLGFSWTPKMVSVEFYLNDTYQGVYTFTEHKKVSKNRVNITPATPENNSGEGLTGGYYLEFENESINEPCWFKSQRYGVTLMFHEPETPTPEQAAWFEQYVNDFESTLYALGHDDRGPKNYQDYIDVDSFINYYILEELCKDPDANFRKSTYITKEIGKKIELYHVWDFDITLGNCNYWGNGLIPENFVLKDCVWYNRLFGKDRDWINKVKKRWNEVYDDLSTIPEFIDQQVILLNGAQNSNFNKWQILGVYVWPNAVWYSTYDEEVNYLKTFYQQRLKWLNTAINNL